jgi:PilZ domain-containing protein/uncharacterized protein DUF4339
MKNMSTKKFFVNNGQANLGPFDMETIAAMVNRLEIKATDHLCVDAEKDEWVMICQHPEFIALVAQTAKPTVKPSLKTSPVVKAIPEAANTVPVDTQTSFPAQAAVPQSPVPQTLNAATASASVTAPLPTGDLTQAQWYVLKGKNRFGPFMYVDMIRMLQEKSVFEFDFVWCQGLEAWKRIAEIPVFNADKIKHLFDHAKANDTIFFRRHHPRKGYECQIIVHDNNRVWKGKAFDLSEGGAGVVIENAMILPGQNIYIHFKPGDISKPFNVLSEVVSKRYMKGIRDHETPVVYGIKFINIQKQDREAIRSNIAA